MDAITSPQSRRYIEAHGEYSPEQRLAIEKLIAHVAARSVAPGPAAKVFFKGPLTQAEKHAWDHFVACLPTEPALPVPRSEPWRPVDPDELRSTFAAEPVFGAWMDKPEGRDFVHRMAEVVNEKTRTMLPTDRGMALLFRFDSTYGTIAHLVLGALWRDATGGLRLSLIHQESVPPQRDTGVWTGVVHGTLDTSSCYPGGRAPVMESMRLAGLPSVNVFPCPRPEAIQHVLADIAGAERRHPYGATDNWNDGQRGNLPAGRPFVTCFNVTHRAMAELFDAREGHAPGLPNTLVAMQPLISSPPGEFDTVTISAGAEEREVRLAEIASEPAANIFKTFTAVGERWGRAAPWDVEGTRRSRKHKATLAPGTTGVSLPEGTRMFKFVAAPKGLVLNGQPVAAGVAYSPDEAACMEYRGTKSSAPLPMVVAVQQAKL